MTSREAVAEESLDPSNLSPAWPRLKLKNETRGGPALLKSNPPHTHPSTSTKIF